MDISISPRADLNDYSKILRGDDWLATAEAQVAVHPGRPHAVPGGEGWKEVLVLVTALNTSPQVRVIYQDKKCVLAEILPPPKPVENMLRRKLLPLRTRQRSPRPPRQQSDFERLEGRWITNLRVQILPLVNAVGWPTITLNSYLLSHSATYRFIAAGCHFCFSDGVREALTHSPTAPRTLAVSSCFRRSNFPFGNTADKGN